MSKNTAEVKITGDAQGAEAAMLKAKEAVATGVEGMKASLEKLNAGFEKISQGFKAMSAVLAGGSALKEFVSVANESVEQARTLGISLGITATEASVLKVALGETHVSQEVVSNAASKITKTLLTNEAAFKKLGVATRDNSGNFRSTFDVMQEANEKLRGFKEGTDRNVEGMKIYGRSWSEISVLVERFKGITDEAREKAESLNLVIGEEALKATLDYQNSQTAVKDVMEGISNTIGQAILPRLTSLGEWFASVGPAAVSATRIAMEAYLSVQDSIGGAVMALWDVVKTAFSSIGDIITSILGPSGAPSSAMAFFGNCLRVVEVAFISLRVGAQLAGEYIDRVIKNLVIVFQTFGEVAKAAHHHDWDGMKTAATSGFKKVEDEAKASIERMKNIALKGGADINAALTGEIGKKSVVTPVAKKEQGLTSKGAVKKPTAENDNVTAKWESINQEAKKSYELQNDLKQRDLSTDIEYWATKLQNSNLNATERLNVSKKYEDAVIASMKQSKATELALGKLGIQEAQANAEQQLNNDRLQAKEALATNQITKEQMLALDIDFENRRSQIVKDGIDADIALYQQDPNRTPQGLADLNAKLEAAERTHQTNMLQLSIEAHLADYENYKMVQNRIVWLADAGIQSMLNGTLTWKNAQKGILNEMAGSFQDFAKKKLESWITTEKLQTAATAAEKAIRQGLVNAGLIEGRVVDTTAAEGEIVTAAQVAAANAFAATAAIPIVGPELAPAAAVAAEASVMSFAALPGFAVGAWNIPSDGITKIHKGETVLNATDAENFRQAKGSGGSNDVHLHVNAIDAHSVKRLFNDHASTIITMLKNQNGKFAV